MADTICAWRPICRGRTDRQGRYGTLPPVHRQEDTNKHTKHTVGSMSGRCQLP